MDVRGARAKIADGILPATDWDWTRLTAGGLRACLVCDEATSPIDMAVECHRANLIVTLHPDCYVAWEEARKLTS